MDDVTQQKLIGRWFDGDVTLTVSGLIDVLNRIKEHGGGDCPIFSKHYRTGSYCGTVIVATSETPDGYAFMGEPTVILADYVEPPEAEEDETEELSDEAWWVEAKKLQDRVNEELCEENERNALEAGMGIEEYLRTKLGNETDE